MCCLDDLRGRWLSELFKCRGERGGERESAPRRGWWWAVALLLSLPVAAHAVVGGTPAPASDHRLDAVALLITDQPWAACGGWISGTCSLIAPDTMLLARHSVENAQRQLPVAGARTHKARFRRAADGTVNGQYGRGPQIDCAGGYQEIFFSRFIGTQLSGIDVVLGVLEHAPVGIQPLPLHVSHTIRSGEPVVLAGWGYDGTCLGLGDAWTLRTKSGVLPTLRTNSACCFDYNLTTFTTGSCFVIPTGSNWVVGNLHDSGAPLLSPDPADPTRLRLFAMVTSVTGAQKLAVWNDGGGQPRLTDTPMPPMCLPDLDGDGVIGLGDLFEFLRGYLGGQPIPDIDGVPGLSLNDLFTFLLRYLGGC